ncbi:MAG: S1C family serine protease, partial [Pirellulaceae bacterium]
GTVVAEDGWIITSLFQFRGEPAAITVILPNGTRKAAKLVARDYARALALLKVEVDEKLIPAKPSPRQRWQIGQWTVALGKTFDLSVASRSIGILSAIDRIFGRAIQTDCKVSPHNYGGPLIDIEGRVMGILAPIDPGIATEGEVQQWYDSGIGFAIPLEDVLQRLPKFIQGLDIHM